MRILCVHIKASSLWSEFVNKNKCLSVRLYLRRIKALNFDNLDNSHNSFLWQEYVINFLCERWIPCIENRIYIEGNLLEKSVKRPFCCTVSILQVYFTYLCYITFWALEYHFRKSKTIVKRKPNYEKGWFHNWPMIISHRLYAFHFTHDDFPFQL